MIAREGDGCENRMMSEKPWIAERLKAVGLRRKDLAAVLGVDPSAITQMIAGRREVRVAEVPKMARALNLADPEIWSLLEATQGETAAPQLLPVVGYVGAGAEVVPFDDHAMGDGIDKIEAPPGASADAVAVLVRGSSMEPVYREGDVIVYERRADDLAALLNRECVVALDDGRVYIKQLLRGSAAGLWTLVSWNAPPIADVRIVWAAPIAWIKRR